MRKTLTDKGVAALKPRPKRYAFPDPQLTGHYVRVQSSGQRSYVAVARDPAGKQTWATIGACDVLSIDEARDRAREAIKRIRAGLPAFDLPPTPDSFRDVAENWIKRHVVENGLRSYKEIVRCLDRYVFPTWQDREFMSIRRSDIAALLDRIQDDHGPRQADYVLAIIRGIANWFSSRHDEYRSPFTRGMRRTDPKTRKRTRILDDNELRHVWRATEGNGRFGAIVRLALLTAQRREKVASMCWADVSVDGIWTVPADDRAKGTGGVLVLPKVAVEIIQQQSRLGNNPHVFAGRGQGPFSGFSKSKHELDAKLPKMPVWTIHDLRRLARSLMARAGVRPDIAERVMGHAIVGVEGVYDRHSYRDEKADALQRLAALIRDIVDPGQANVVSMTKRRKRR